MLLDGGSGTLHGLARHRVDWPALTHVVVSHYHNDHVGDLSGVLFTLKYGLARAREEPLTLIGPSSTHRSGLDRVTPRSLYVQGSRQLRLRDHSHRGSTFRTPSVHSAFAMHDQGEGMRALLENGPRSRLILDNGADSTFRPRVTYPPPTTATLERMGLLMGPMEIWLI